MAIEFIEAVWQISPYKAERLLVQLACADWANHDGEFWPSFDQIADKARITKPGAIGIIQQLIEDNDIVLVEKGGGGRGKRNRYRFSEDYLMTVDQVRETWAAARERKGKRALPKAEPERVNEDAVKGKPELAHIRNNRHEPSKEEDTLSDALASIFPGHESNRKLMEEFTLLAMKLSASPAMIRLFPEWLKKNHPLKAISPFAFKDLFHLSLQPTVKSNPATHRPYVVEDWQRNLPRE